MMSLSEKMIKYRAKHGLSQGALADACNVSKQTIFNIEHNIQDPTRLTEAKIKLIIDQDEEE